MLLITLSKVEDYYNAAKDAIVNSNNEIAKFFSTLLTIVFFLLLIEAILYVCKRIEKARKK